MSISLCSSGKICLNSFLSNCTNLPRNPWGERGWDGNGEWNGPWSDGSKEWTPYWMQKLNHTFGDDGLFWMSYEDMLKRFDILERTRLFDQDWTIVQQWTSVNVSWVTGYLTTKFVVEIKKGGPTVFVLSQVSLPVPSWEFGSDLASLTTAISAVWKVNTNSIFTFCFKKRVPHRGSTLSELAGPGGVTDQFLLKWI